MSTTALPAARAGAIFQLAMLRGKFHGAMAPTTNFVVYGNNEESLFGVCESMYKENLEPEELFEVIAQCLLAGVNRDCLSGWGGVVHVISKDKLITRTLKGRMD